MKIDKIYIACSKKDFYFARLCISSIRYWNIQTPIELVIDYAWGDLNTTYLEKHWGVKRFNAAYKVFKESYSKLEPLFENTGKRIFTMDADIILLGNIVEELEKIEADFICQQIHTSENDGDLNKWWFNFEKLQSWDPGYQYPGYIFYAGQLVTNEGIFKRDEFNDILLFGNPPQLKRPEIFLNNADQGILNYVLAKKITSSKLSVVDFSFFLSRYDAALLKKLKKKNVQAKNGKPLMIHYNGPKNGLLFNLPAEELLRFFERYYYQYYPYSVMKQYSDRLLRTIIHPIAFIKELVKKTVRFTTQPNIDSD